ncbi:MAG TPA: MraY family glycosyltransferase [Candidatus Acidoferrales bacterium]|nr:MraY family glycosyltransferase [Candidatus Acidoferrales bacterium]
MSAIPTELIAFVVALVAALGLTVPVRALALRYGMVDLPGPRKVHLKPMPLLGGIAIYLAFILSVVLTLHAAPEQQVVGILAGATLVAAVGVLDDGGLLHHQVKLFVSMPVAGLFLVATGIHADLFARFVPGISGRILDDGFTIFWVVGVTAAFSILDHMDGLCAGIAAVAAAFFTICATVNGQVMVRVLAAATLGAALGFLRWNFNPAKIFMGDAGAMFLGFLMATLGLKMRANAPFPVNWLVPLLILGVPIFDTALVSVSRARRGLLPFTSPGKDHMAHRLSNLGLGQRSAVLAMYCLAIAFGILAFWVPRFSSRTAFTLSGSLLAFGIVSVALLERAPFERQIKRKKSPTDI